MKYNGIQTDRLEDFARRLLGIRNGGVVPTLSPECAIEVGLPQTLDLLALSGAWPYCASGAYAAVAGEFPCVVITNSSTNFLMTVELRVATAATSTWRLVRGTRTLDGAGPITVLTTAEVDYLDTRRTRGNFPTGIAAGQTSFQSSTILAATSVGLNRIGQRKAVGAGEAIMPEVVLAPGESISCFSDVANQGMLYEAVGTIRIATTDELATP